MILRDASGSRKFAVPTSIAFAHQQVFERISAVRIPPIQ
jgi:hypothetical protein